MNPKQDYIDARNQLRAQFFDPEVNLEAIGWSEADQAASDRLEKLREDVVQQKGYYDMPWEAQWFVDVREKIEGTGLFRLLKGMPKGAILHIHPSAMGDFDALLKAAGEAGASVLADLSKESKDLPMFSYDPDVGSDYTPLSGALADRELHQTILGKLVLTGEELDLVGDAWELFQPVFTRVGELLKPVEIRRGYFGKAMAALLEDNVQHVELRTSWGKHPDTDAAIQDAVDAAAGLSYRVIYSDSRMGGPSGGPDDYDGSIMADMEHVLELMSRESPVVGFDLVAEEDTGHVTYYFLDDILNVLEERKALPPFYFHDGESELPPDYLDEVDPAQPPSKHYFNNNLLDAYLLNTMRLGGYQLSTNRVGHAVSLFKTPGLLRDYIKAGLCVELCPISNQLLKYTLDLREHPGQAYLAAGLPVSLSPDDPAIYGYQGVTHDFWIACIAWGLDLRAIKLLCHYSIENSSLAAEEKGALREQWSAAWDRWASALG